MLFKKIGLILLGSSICSAFYAQQATVATGGNASGTGGEVNYSIGQIDYNSYTSGASVNEGVQQPFEFYLVVGMEELEDVSIQLYPNPSSDYITLLIDSDRLDLHYRLSDLNGKIILEADIQEEKSTIDIHALAQGSYHLELIQKSTTLNTYKLIKH